MKFKHVTILIGSAFLTTLFVGHGVGAAMPSLSGAFHGTFGTLMFKESSDGSIVGRLRTTDQCQRKKGTIVFTGSKLEDSVTGSLKACFNGSKNCQNDEVNAPVLLLVSPDGNKMTGVAHLPSTPQGCLPVLKSEGVVFKRVQKSEKKQKVHRKLKPQKSLKAPQISHKTQKKKPVEKIERQVARIDEAAQLMGAGKAEAARAIFMEVIEKEEKKEVAYNGLGVTFYMRERYDEAMKAYKKAVDINPMYPDPYYNLACLYALNNNADQAFRYLNMAFLNGYIDAQTLDHDQDLDNIRKDPRFKKLKEGAF